MKNRQKGFTLVELLVVISIIALLSSIVLLALNSAKMKARDSKRIQDLKQIQIALEMYKNDNGGKYPSSLAIGCGEWCISTVNTNWTAFENILKTGKYLSALPKDPINRDMGGSNIYPFNYSTNYNYAYSSGAAGRGCVDMSCYDLVANLEDTGSPYRNEIKNYHYINSSAGDTWTIVGNSMGPPPGETSQLYSPQN